MNSKPVVLVSGAGIAGLTLAIALLRRGIDVEVYEQAPELREIGAGIQIGPNGSRVLIDLGLRDAMEAIVCEAAMKEVRHWQSGASWKLFDLGADCITRFGAPYWMAHRGDFHRVLLDGLLRLKPDAVHLGAAVTGFATEGEKISARLADGTLSKPGDVLVGADGVHSALRAAMGHSDRPAFTGIMAWRGLTPAEKLPENMRRPVGVNWVGPGGHVITYPLRGGSLYNFVGIVEGRDWAVESWIEAGTTEECLADFAGWHPEVIDTIRYLDTPFKWAMLGREPLSAWASGRVCLLGDACHPTLPFLAQGANMAIEDALVLARCLSALGPNAAALKEFEALRVERTSSIVRKSRAMATHFHNPALADAATAIDYIDREWTPEKVRTRYDWLYEYDAGAVKIGGDAMRETA